MANESNFAFSNKIPVARSGKILAGVQTQSGDPDLYSWDVPNTGQVVIASGGSYNVTVADRGKLLVVVNSLASFLLSLPDPLVLVDPAGVSSFKVAVANISASGASGCRVIPSTKPINGTSYLQVDSGKGVEIFCNPDGFYSVNGLGSSASGGGGSGDVTGPASSVDSDFVQFNGTTGKIIKDGGLSLDTDGTLAADSDSRVASQKATKTYSDRQASDTAFGVCKVDGTTITATSGVISAVGGGVTPGTFIYASDTGSANAIAIAATGVALAAGLVAAINVGHTVTGATTIALNGGAAKGLKKYQNIDLFIGDVLAGDIIWCVYDGTNWQMQNPRTVPFFTVPLKANFTILNQGTYTYSDDGPYLKVQANSATGTLHSFVAAQPSTPYTVVFQVAYNIVNANSGLVGLYFADGTTTSAKYLGIEMLCQANITTVRVERWTGTSTQTATQISIPAVGHHAMPQRAPLHFKAQNDGSTLTFFYSLDQETWISAYSESVGTFLTPTQVAMGFLANGPWVNLMLRGFQTFAGLV